MFGTEAGNHFFGVGEALLPVGEASGAQPTDCVQIDAIFVAQCAYRVDKAPVGRRVEEELPHIVVDDTQPFVATEVGIKNRLLRFRKEFVCGNQRFDRVFSDHRRGRPPSRFDPRRQVPRCGGQESRAADRPPCRRSADRR